MPVITQTGFLNASDESSLYSSFREDGYLFKMRSGKNHDFGRINDAEHFLFDLCNVAGNMLEFSLLTSTRKVLSGSRSLTSPQ